MRCSLRVVVLCGVLAAAAGRAGADRLRLVADGVGADAAVHPVPLQPVDVYLVAERDSTHRQVSAVAYTLSLPDGVLLVGEELLVESILGLGTSRTGLNLVFRCVENSTVRVQRFRFVATHPVQNAVVALRPDTRTKFLGIVSCRDEDFAKFSSPVDSVRITTR